jgi:TRAP-type C4-dicarboxylate transport system permease small subunit
VRAPGAGEDAIRRSADALLRWTNRQAARLAGAILLVLLAVILYEVAARYAFNHAVMWSFDVTAYGLLFVVFLAAAFTLEQDGHIRLDFLLVRLPPRARRRAELTAEALGILFLLLLLWATARETLIAVRGGWVSPSFYAIPLKYVYWIMPAGTALVLLTAIARLAARVARRP